MIGKRVAVKVLHRRFSADAEMISRFVAEARAVNRIRHHHIIDIFSFGTLDDGCGASRVGVSCRGGHRGPSPEGEGLRISPDLARSLAVAGSAAANVTGHGQHHRLAASSPRLASAPP